VFEPPDHAQGGGLAASGWTEERVEATPVERQAHAINGAMAREILDDLTEFEDGRHSD
jgi:hypothetical protein